MFINANGSLSEKPRLLIDEYNNSDVCTLWEDLLKFICDIYASAIGAAAD